MKKLLPTLLSIILTLSAILLASQTIEASWNLDKNPPTPVATITCGASSFNTGATNQCPNGTTADIFISCSDNTGTYNSNCKTTSCSGSTCVSYNPWIQTTGGDVHSNTSINLPGGP